MCPSSFGKILPLPSHDVRICWTGVLMQGRREISLGKARTSATYLRCLISPFFPFSFIFAFLTPALCSVAQSHRSERVSTLLTVQSALFRDLLLDGVLR